MINIFSTAQELRIALDKKIITPQESVQFFAERIKNVDPSIDSVLDQFDADQMLSTANPHGSLYGIPGLTKANICVEGQLTTCASKILHDFRPTYDATAISRLKHAGAVVIGAANMDEFAMGSSTETSAFKKTKNPWNTRCVPGGSSGGSAAAVAAGIVPWALGSDTGGSVRQPAAFCGIVGLKPTYGLISRYGLIAYGSSFDQIGVLSRSVYDSAMILSVMAGRDARDSSSLPVEQKDYTKELTGTLPAGIRIGIVDNALSAEGMDEEVCQAVQETIATLQGMGAHIKHVSLPILDYSAAAYFILSRAEAASNLARFDGVRYGMRAKTESLSDMYAQTRHDGFGPEVRSRIMVGNYVLSAGHADEFYGHAKTVKRLIRQAYVDVFKEVDVLVMPTHPAPAFEFGSYDDNKLQMDLQDYFTCSINLAGIPALSLPCGLTKNKMPIGFQLIGPHCAESLLLQVGHAYEQNTPWHTYHPEGF